MGAVRKILAVLALSVVALSYWLYSPVPEGYSSSTTTGMRLIFAGMKAADAVIDIAECLGFGSHINLTRALIKLSAGSPPTAGLDPDIRTEDAIFDGVPVRIYTPTVTKEIRPGFVFIHGGGWVMGSVDMSHPLVILLSRLTNTVVVSVEYRLAPEWIFPAAHDDCVAATKYFMKNAKKYNVDADRIAVGGDSAGGNLAATVALRLRDELFEPKLKMQVLIYPSLQALDFQLPSMQQNARGPLLTNEKTTFFKCMYLDGNQLLANIYQNNGHVPLAVKQKMSETYLNVAHLPEKYLKGYKHSNTIAGDENIWEKVRERILNPYFAPLVADDLTRLPMSYVFTCEHDLLRDEGLLYAYRLREAGNDVTSVNAEMGFHGVMSFADNFPEPRAMLEDMAEYIVSHL